jgi:CRP/FNR family transcriptional regulator
MTGSSSEQSIVSFVHRPNVRMPSVCQGADLCVQSCMTCDVRALGICGALEPPELAELATILTQTLIAPKCGVFAQGDPADYVYTVTSGCIRLSKDLADGRRQIVGFALPGDFLGLSLARDYEFSADSLESATLCRFERRRFKGLLQDKPHRFRRIYEMAAHELTIAQDQMLLLGRRRADEKVAIFLLNWRHRLYKLTGADQTLHLPMTRQDIADYLGLTIETVSRMISLLVRRKILLIIPEGVRIMDLDALQALAH